MEARIAVVTLFGKAYYKLTNELSKRNVPFLSLRPKEYVPLHVKAVITTLKERHLVDHSEILIFKDNTNPSTIVDQAIRLVEGKRFFKKLIIGVDPGETSGIALLGDGRILGTVSSSTLEETVSIILRYLSKLPTEIQVVKIGKGVPILTKKLLRSLESVLPKKVIIETVNEFGTSQLTSGKLHHRCSKDVVSAIRIAERRGQRIHRGGPYDTRFR